MLHLAICVTNRHAINPPKVVTPAVAPEIIPQITIAVGRYRDGLPILSRNIFEGTDTDQLMISMNGTGVKPCIKI